MGNPGYYTVRWGNPYTEPTGERILAQEPAGSGTEPSERIATLIREHPGYALAWDYDAPPIKRIPEERRIATRNNRKETAIRKRYPMLADWLIEQERPKWEKAPEG